VYTTFKTSICKIKYGKLISERELLLTSGQINVFVGQKPFGNKLKPGEVKNILVDILKTGQINKILVERAEFCCENLSFLQNYSGI